MAAIWADAGQLFEVLDTAPTVARNSALPISPSTASCLQGIAGCLISSTAQRAILKCSALSWATSARRSSAALPGQVPLESGRLDAAAPRQHRREHKRPPQRAQHLPPSGYVSLTELQAGLAAIKTSKPGAGALRQARGLNTRSDFLAAIPGGVPGGYLLRSANWCTICGGFPPKSQPAGGYASAECTGRSVACLPRVTQRQRMRLTAAMALWITDHQMDLVASPAPGPNWRVPLTPTAPPSSSQYAAGWGGSGRAAPAGLAMCWEIRGFLVGASS